MNFADRVSKAALLMDEAHELLRKGPLSFYLREMSAAYELLMSRYAPFKVGDRVKLAKTPDITPEHAPGWMSCRHFLVQGAIATVSDARCGEGGFRFDVMFDGETWLDREGVERPISEKHTFTFREASLERA